MLNERTNGSFPNWEAYYAASMDAQPRATLLNALHRFEHDSTARTNRFAVDLGCGGGQDTLELLRRGWRVLAIDAESSAVERVQARSALAHYRRVEARVALFGEASWSTADLINASYSLPFCTPAVFPVVWTKIVRSLRPGGRFAGQLFGDRDSWAALPDRTHHSRRAVQALLASFDLELLREDETDGVTLLGEPHHWHVFHIVACRQLRR